MTREVPLGRRVSDLVALLGGLAMFLACAFLASDGRVGPDERAVFDAINGLPRWLEPLMQGAQFLGVLMVGPVLALIALALGRARLAFAIVLVTLTKLVAERIVWEILVRERPGTTIPGAIVASGVSTEGPAFVSGHVVLTTAISVVATPWLPRRWRPVPWIAVALVALARPYLGAHAPLDVVGGLGLGLAIGGAANLLVGVPAGRPEPRMREATVPDSPVD